MQRVQYFSFIAAQVVNQIIWFVCFCKQSHVQIYIGRSLFYQVDGSPHPQPIGCHGGSQLICK